MNSWFSTTYSTDIKMHISVSYVNRAGMRMYLALVGVVKLISSLFFSFLVVHKITTGHILDSMKQIMFFN